MNCKSVILTVAVSLQLNANAQNVSSLVFSSDGETFMVPECTGKRQIVGGTVIRVKYKGVIVQKKLKGLLSMLANYGRKKFQRLFR